MKKLHTITVVLAALLTFTAASSHAEETKSAAETAVETAVDHERDIDEQRREAWRFIKPISAKRQYHRAIEYTAPSQLANVEFRDLFIEYEITRLRPDDRESNRAYKYLVFSKMMQQIDENDQTTGQAYFNEWLFRQWLPTYLKNGSQGFAG